MKLTEKEFEMLIEALECLPNKDMGGSILSKLTAAMLFKGDDEGMAKAKAEIAKREEEEELRRKEERKMCCILTGKLYMMKDDIVEAES